MSLEKVFHRFQQNLKYGDFYKCSFCTWDNEKNQVILRWEQNLVFFSIGLNGLYILLQIIAAIKAPKSSLVDTVETVGITITVLIIFLLRFDLNIDQVPLQLLNYIYGIKGYSLIDNLCLPFNVFSPI
jgi:uncharacterized membrane protein